VIVRLNKELGVTKMRSAMLPILDGCCRTGVSDASKQPAWPTDFANDDMFAKTERARARRFSGIGIGSTGWSITASGAFWRRGFVPGWRK